MPRNHHPGASTLRNRIRITNKTRLRIYHGNIDADALLIPDEDEEKHRLTNLVAGVDADDANEHHLQAVLSAASQRNHVNANRPTRGASDKSTPNAPPAAYIPTPDSTGIVDNYEDLYPPDRWKDPATYLSTSTTVEESCKNALANGFTYYMDERDKDWLDKNNEEARGEGTSAQGAVSASGIRTSARSAKAKGKEPEVSQPVVISEDEFELVMGVFEKVTHEKTEYLHHGLETGMAFPAFSEYQETFASVLPPPTFATYTVPSWLPPPDTLVRLARAIYPYWKERRIERGGHRIIPVLNGDESDTLNESYICFRRREIKAVRKTRASQVTSSDKLIRLQTELSYPLEIAKAIFARENHKKDTAYHAQQVWEKRLALTDLKRKFPALGDKPDEELLIDKEKPKKPELSRPIKIRTHELGAPTARPEVAIRPRERTNLIREQIEHTLNRQKDVDHHWEDQVDNVYQAPPVPYASRLFKYYTPPSSSPSEGEPAVRPRAIRLRRGRGGRMLIDRRDDVLRPAPVAVKRSALFDLESGMDVDQDEDEKTRMIVERWRFDADDCPAVGPLGSDEQDRVLVDDYSSKYLRHAMTLLVDSDQQSLMTDPSIPVQGPDGRQQMIVPFRLGMPQPVMRRDAAGVVRPYAASGPPIPSQVSQQPGIPLSLPLTPSNATPVSVQQQLKKMPPPTAVPQMRISSNGGMRPPLPVVASMQGNISVPLSSSPVHSASLPQHSPTNGNNGVNRAAINMPHVDAVKSEVTSNISNLNGIQMQPPLQADINQSNESTVNGVANSPPAKPQNNHAGMATAAATTNGYHVTSMNGYSVAAISNTAPYSQHLNNQHGLSLQQVQNLKSAFANMPAGQELASLQANVTRSMPASYLHVVPNVPNFNIQQLNAGANINLKLPATRQMQWTGTPTQKSGSMVNGIDGQRVNGSISPSPGHAIPVRTPSAGGTRPSMRIGSNGQMGVHSISPHHQHSPSPMPSAISQSQSPPRLPLTPTMTMASPSLQHQQPVGSSKNGY